MTVATQSFAAIAPEPALGTGFSDTSTDRPGLNRTPALRPRTVAPVREAIPVTGIDRDISVKIAATSEEWNDALSLVAERYRDKGYIDSESVGNYFTLYHALPDTATFIAEEASRAITTLSLVLDNTALGLPMDVIYREELDALRRRGHRLGEITCLADRDLKLREFMPVFMTVCRLMFQYSAHQGCNEWVIEVNPRHSRFYRKVWGFIPLGPRRSCPTVEGAPAEAFYLNIDLMKANAPDTYNFVYGDPLPLEALAPVTMPARIAKRLALRSVRTNLDAVEEVLSFVDHYGNPRAW
jgi:hypothetical protein